VPDRPSCGDTTRCSAGDIPVGGNATTDVVSAVGAGAAMIEFVTVMMQRITVTPPSPESLHSPACISSTAVVVDKCTVQVNPLARGLTQTLGVYAEPIYGTPCSLVRFVGMPSRGRYASLVSTVASFSRRIDIQRNRNARASIMGIRHGSGAK